MPRSTASLPLLLTLWCAPALAQDDPWGVGTGASDDSSEEGTDDHDDSVEGTPWDPNWEPPADPPPSEQPPSEQPPSEATPLPPPRSAPAPDAADAPSPWDPPPRPPTWVPAAGDHAPPPVAIPVQPAPASLGFASRQDCRASWQEGRSALQRLVPTWQHPTLPRCFFADGAGRWHRDDRDDRDERPAMVLNATLDGSLLAIGGGLLVADLLLPPLDERHAENWDASGSPVGAAGTDAQRRDGLPVGTSPSRGAAMASDVLLVGAWAGAAASPVLLPERNGRITNTVVMAEVMGLNAVVTQLVKDTTAEARPLAYQDMSDWTDDDFAWAADALLSDGALQSYFSGHTSHVAAFAYGWSTIQVVTALEREDERAGLYLLLYPAAFTLSSLQGSLRVDALKHDGADVTLGHLTGAMIGAGVPLLHHGLARKAHARATARKLTLTPTVAPGAVGVTGRW